MRAERYPDGPSNDALERICDAHWNAGGEGIVFFDIYQHNACNHTLSGTIDIDGKLFGFIIDNGDWNGTVVREWGDADDVGRYEPPEPPPLRTFLPTDLWLHISKPEMFRVYVLWRKEPWFQEEVRKYNYDRHFQPGDFVERHYRDWAAKKGLRVGLLTELPADAQKIIAKARAA